MEKNITPINQLSWKDRLKSYKKHPGSFILLLLVGTSAVITVTVLIYLVGYILIHGVPYLRPSLFSLTYNSDNVSMMPAIINTITMVLLALLFSVPFGIGAAIYLVEYAKKGNKLVELVRITGRDMDKLARDIIEEAGYGDNFGHSLGHGVGLEIHEFPNASPGTLAKLETGNVVTVEPGIYLPGEFGVRIEDFVVIRENGCENLTEAPKQLTVL